MLRVTETDFKDEATEIPHVVKTESGWFDPEQPLPVVAHGAGYGAFSQHLRDHGIRSSEIARNLPELLKELPSHVMALQGSTALARAADIFLGNAINASFSTTWFPASWLAVAHDGGSVDLEGSALALAQNPNEHSTFLLGLQGMQSQRGRSET